MAGFARLILLGLVALTALYWVVRVYARSLRREELEKHWDATNGAGLPSRETYIAEGMAGYERSLRRKLVWLVYILPITALIAVLVFMNYQW